MPGLTLTPLPAGTIKFEKLTQADDLSTRKRPVRDTFNVVTRQDKVTLSPSAQKFNISGAYVVKAMGEDHPVSTGPAVVPLLAPVTIDDIQKMGITQRDLRSFFDQTKAITSRMSELAKQASDPAMSDADRTALNTEFQALKGQLASRAQSSFPGLDANKAAQVGNFFGQQVGIDPSADILTAGHAQKVGGMIADVSIQLDADAKVLVKPKLGVGEMLQAFNKDMQEACANHDPCMSTAQRVMAAVARLQNWFSSGGYYEDPPAAPTAGV